MDVGMFGERAPQPFRQEQHHHDRDQAEQQQIEAAELREVMLL